MLIVKKTAVRIAREASLAGKSVRVLILRDKVLTEDQLDKILDPCEMTSPGIAGLGLTEVPDSRRGQHGRSGRRSSSPIFTLDGT